MQTVNFFKFMDWVERTLILETLDRLNWNKQEAANSLGVNRTTLVMKCRKLGIPVKPAIYRRKKCSCG